MRSIVFMSALFFAPHARAAQDENTLSLFSFTHSRPENHIALLKKYTAYDEYEVRFESPHDALFEENKFIYGSYFEPAGKGPFPAVVVLHEWKSGNASNAKRLARTLARHQMAAFVMQLPYHMKRFPKAHGNLMVSPDVDTMVDASLQAVKDVMRTVDWLTFRKSVDAEKIGIAGISMGGVFTHLACGVDDRLKACVSILGGADVGKIIYRGAATYSVYVALKKKGITLSALRKKLMPVDPLTYAHREARKKVLMINGAFDFVVPRGCASALWEALDKPEIVWLPADHFTAFFFNKIIQEKTTAFLKINLNKENDFPEW